VLLGLAIAFWWWRRPASAAPRRLFVALVAIFYVATTPVGAALLVFGLGHGLRPIETPSQARGADAVVVLGGGVETVRADGVILGNLSTTSALRTLEGARVYKMIGARIVIVSGGIANSKLELRPESELMRDALVTAGVPAESVVQDREAKTTHDHPRTLRPILEEHHVRQFVVVTSRQHMRRALAVFRAAGFDPVPSISPLRSDQLDLPPLLLPNDESLMLSNQALYDYVALADYWWRGWLAPASASR
jgi:uncharacterized SAM-binding protein YcdF (DUF218 family)